MHAALPGFPYNYSIHSLPFSAAEVPGFRWHIEILPRIGSTAGFEWGGGCYINTVPPEDAAQTLRSVDAV
jgi:UDPglucose--hexose-1-phosphate uridylyltransferase